MNSLLRLDVPDDLRQSIAQAAAALGQSPEEWAIAVLRQRIAGADIRLRRHFGAVNLGHPTDAANERIDQELAQAYCDRHERA